MNNSNSVVTERACVCCSHKMSEIMGLIMVACLETVLLCLVAESELLDRIKKNKVSKAHFLIQKALLMYNNNSKSNKEPDSSTTKSLLEVTHTQHCWQCNKRHVVALESIQRFQFWQIYESTRKKHDII